LTTHQIGDRLGLLVDDKLGEVLLGQLDRFGIALCRVLQHLGDHHIDDWFLGLLAVLDDRDRLKYSSSAMVDAFFTPFGRRWGLPDLPFWNCHALGGLP